MDGRCAAGSLGRNTHTSCILTNDYMNLPQEKLSSSITFVEEDVSSMI